MLEKIQETAAYLQSVMKTKPETAIILGTGLGSLVNEITEKYEVEYKDIPNFPLSTDHPHPAPEFQKGLPECRYSCPWGLQWAEKSWNASAVEPRSIGLFSVPCSHFLSFVGYHKDNCPFTAENLPFRQLRNLGFRGIIIQKYKTPD